MEFQQLRHLIAAARYGNLLKAAEMCNLTQSGLSRSVTSLEQRLGVPLLIRSAKGVKPTVFGESVIRRAELILNEVNRSVAEVAAIAQGRIGDVSLGITQNYAHYLMPTLLADFHAERPEIHMHVVTGGFLEVIGKVESSALDLGFGLIGAVEQRGELIIEPLREHYSRVVARSARPLAHAADVSVAELSAAHWATLDGEGFERNFINFFEFRGHRIPVQVLRTDSIDLIRRFALRRDVLTVLPADVVKEELESGTMTILACETQAETTRLGLIYRADSLVSPPVRLLAERIRALFHQR
ncbi:MAG: LysR family transcriptional regulator [Acetobacteraceae bacterium]